MGPAISGLGGLRRPEGDGILRPARPRPAWPPQWRWLLGPHGTGLGMDVWKTMFLISSRAGFQVPCGPLLGCTVYKRLKD